MLARTLFPAPWLTVFAALALSAAVARSPDLGVPAANAAGGTRMSTADVGAEHTIAVKAPVAGEFPEEPARQAEIRAAYAARAAQAGAELVWDAAGPSLIGISPVLHADPALALPGAAPVKLLAVDMAKLYDNHPRTLDFNAKIQADDNAAQKEVDQMNVAGNALVDEYKKLLEKGDKAGAEKKYAEIEAKKREVMGFIAATRDGLKQRMQAFRALQLHELSVEAVKAARRSGATLVLDTAGPSLLGVSCVVYIDPAARPAADGGVGSEPARVAHVRTVDLGRLYDAHPRTREVEARIRDDDRRAKADADRMNQERSALLEAHTRVEQGDEPATKVAAEKKLSEAKALGERAKALAKESREQAKRRLEAHRSALLGELAKAAAEAAQRAGATLLLDTAGRSLTGVSHIAYAAPQLDLTAEVAKALGIALVR